MPPRVPSYLSISGPRFKFLPTHASDTLGRQVNFFMAREDENIFVNHAKGSGKVGLFPNVLATGRIEPIQALPDKVSPTLAEKRFFLFNHSVSSQLFSIQSKNGSHYSFDWMRSSAIEFQRCFIQERIMYPGRIFADFTAHDIRSGITSPREAEFEEWYDSLARWIRKTYHPIRLYDPGRSRVPSLVLYAGPGAQSFYRAGGKFSVNPPGGTTLMLVDPDGKTTIVEKPRNESTL